LSWFFHSLSLFLTHPTSPLFPYTTLFRSKRYSSRKNLVPPEHVLVFDEAQRAFDADKMGQTHANTPGFTGGRSEPEHLVEFAERIPGWCVVIGLIGSGQEIHVGEEGGLVQWRQAVEQCTRPSAWIVHGSRAL